MSKIKSSINVLMIMVLIAPLIVGSIPLAHAMATPSVTIIPGIPVIGGTPTIKLTGASDGSTPHADIRVGLREPTSTGVTLDTGVPPVGGFLAPPGGECGLDRYSSGAGSYWVLTTDGAAVSVGNMLEIDLPGVGDMALIPFAPGMVTITYTGGASGPAMGEWVDDNAGAAKAPSITILATTIPFDPYSVRVCGFDDATTTDGPFKISKEFVTQQPVAGKVLPLDTSALLLAGFSSNPVWILSALAVVAGGALTLLRFQVSKRNI